MFSLFKQKRAYFDYASAAPLDKRVLKAMLPYISGTYANPSSLYKEGVETRKAIDESRKVVAAVLQVKPEDIIFTGGGTESNNLALLGTFFHQKNVLKKEKIHIITTSIEHSSILEVCEQVKNLGGKVTYVSPKENGIIDPKEIEAAITPETVLVSVMYANNEIGTIQPIREIGALVKMKKEKGQDILFHVDACQGASYLSLKPHDLLVDMMTLDGSKIYGPKGSGILYKKRILPLEPIVFGGGQEQGLRSGTENVASIVGFAEALRIAQLEKAAESEHLRKLQARIISSLTKEIKQLKLNGDADKRLPNNVNICLPGLDAEYAVLRMDVLGFSISSVTTCRTLSEDSSSYVIEELYKNEDCSRSSLRITLGRFTTEKEVDSLIKNLLTILRKQ
jgi:cysteine desulfurase